MLRRLVMLNKMLMFRQSSPVHPAISIEIPIHNNNGRSNSNYDQTGGGEMMTSHSRNNNNHNDDDSKGNKDDGTSSSKVCTSLVFLASGCDCAVVEIMYNPRLYSKNQNQHSRVNHVDCNDLEDVVPVTLLPSPSVNSGSIVIGPP